MSGPGLTLHVISFQMHSGNYLNFLNSKSPDISLMIEGTHIAGHINNCIKVLSTPKPPTYFFTFLSGAILP